MSYINDIDFGEDYLRWMRTCERVRNFSTVELESMQDEIVKNNDSALAYFFASDFGYKSYKMQKVILDNKNPQYAFLFAKNIHNSDSKALQNLIFDSKNIKYIAKFACFIHNSDYKKAQKLLLNSKNIKYISLFLKHCKNADYKSLKNIIIKSGKPKYLLQLAKKCKLKKDITVIQNLIIKSGSSRYIRLFAQFIKLADQAKLEEAIIELGDICEIKKFAKMVKRSKLANFKLSL